MMLVVKCEESEGGRCRFAEDGTCSCKDGYRPLNVDEVEEMGEIALINTQALIDDIQEGYKYSYKGQPVKIVPAEGV
jgi:hypothetical protein